MKIADAVRMSAGIGRSAFLRRRPFLLYMKPSARCDVRCATCNRWQHPSPRHEELPLEPIQEILGKLRRAGCQVLTLWGGEPTLREDLPEILRRAKELGYRTAMCSNAGRLESQVDGLAPHLDLLLCSLDGYGEVHDELRGVPGLFERVRRGLVKLTTHPASGEVRLWVSVNRRSVAQLRRLVELAVELGVAVEFFPLTLIKGYNEELVLDTHELRDAFAEIGRLKRDGFPVRNPDRMLRVMRQSERFRCNFGLISIHVDHQGRVYSCEDAEGRPFHVWGDHRSFDPDAVFSSAAFRELAEKLRECQCCRFPCVVDLSGSLPMALVRTALAGTLERRPRRRPG